MTTPRITRDILGVPVDALRMADVLRMIDRAIDTRDRLLIGVVNAAKVVNMRRDAALRAAVLSSDVILADGASVVVAARLLGCPLPERVAGIDLMFDILRHGHERRYRIFCLGGTDDVLATVRSRIADEYPGVVLAGDHHGYFSADQEEQVADAIRRSRPDVLLVGITSPKKERFLGRWGGALDVPVCHGVGGSFDVFAGRVRRAPEAWQRLGLEWLHRVMQEPRRLWRRYLVTNAMFAGLLLGALCRTAPGRVARSLRAGALP